MKGPLALPSNHPFPAVRFCFDLFFPLHAIANSRCSSSTLMERKKSRGYALAFSAGLNAALAAISAKLFASQLIKYGLVVFFNVMMWGCYINSLKALSSLQATVTNFATNFLSSGLAGFFLFEESLPSQWFAGALFIVLGVIVLSKSSIEKKARQD